MPECSASATGYLGSRLYEGPAFESFGLDAVVKVGGSLLEDMDAASRLASLLADMRKRFSLLIFPGGGPTDNLIEEIADDIGLPDYVIHPACMRALDQTGILFSALEPNMRPVSELAGVRGALQNTAVPVLLPCELIGKLGVFTRTNVLTSDTMGAYFCFILGAPLYVVLTNVDGIYKGYEHSTNERKLLNTIKSDELAGLPATSVDRCLGHFTDATGLRVWIVNGLKPERLVQVLGRERPIGTEIVP